MASEKMKTLLFTILFVLPLAYLHKFFFPETSKTTGFLLIISLLIIFHTIGRFIFARPKKDEKK